MTPCSLPCQKVSFCPLRCIQYLEHTGRQRPRQHPQEVRLQLPGQLLQKLHQKLLQKTATAQAVQRRANGFTPSSNPQHHNLCKFCIAKLGLSFCTVKACWSRKLCCEVHIVRLYTLHMDAPLGFWLILWLIFKAPKCAYLCCAADRQAGNLLDQASERMKMSSQDLLTPTPMSELVQDVMAFSDCAAELREPPLPAFTSRLVFSWSLLLQAVLLPVKSCCFFALSRPGKAMLHRIV